MNKRIFSRLERYVVWQYHDQRCWRCKRPLELGDTTVDHLIPESFLQQEEKLIWALGEFELDPKFNIDGFENWLPSCDSCNRQKGNNMPRKCEANRDLLHKLFYNAAKISRLRESIEKSTKKDKILGKLAIAFEKEELTADELIKSMRKLGVEIISHEPIKMIQLDRGYWIREDEIVRSGPCQCERNHCVGTQGKVPCLFTRYLPEWVIVSGLYWKCYDEIIECHRCREEHKRGHIGRSQICGRPYANQKSQKD